MAEKDIILRINAVTNQDVVESYGKEIDELLGTYEQWIKTSQDATAIIDGLNKKVKQGKTLSDAEIRTLNEEKAKRTEALRLMRQEDKIRTSANGSLKQQQLLLSKVNDAMRKMTDEQKKANPELVKFQKTLQGSVKGMNAELGNFQMNVGNYPQLLQQILPVQTQVGQGIMNVGKSAGLSTGALATLGAALGAGAIAYAGFQQAMELTQTVGDAVAIKIEGWSAVWDRFIRMVVSMDFSNFWEQMRRVKEAAEESAAALDELFERNNALTIAEAKASITQQQNLKIMRDQTKSLQERIAAGKAYEESVKELAKLRQDIAQQEFNANLANFAKQTGMTEEDVKFYIENYEKYRATINAVNEAKGKDLVKFQELLTNLTEEERKFYMLGAKYNLGNDELTANLVQSWARVYTTISSAEQATNRAATTVSGLINQQNKQGVKNTTGTKLNSKKGNTSPFRIDTQSLMDDILAEWEALEEEVTMAINRGDYKPVALPSDNTSPLAKMLGVTNEDLEIIKGKALQAAQQIYNSIQQLSQQATQRRLDDELKAIEDKTESEKAILKAKLDNGVLTQKQYEKKIAAIDEAAEKRREEAKKEAFEKEKKWNILTAIMNTAMGVTAALKQLPSPKAWIEAALVTATGTAQVATIAAQKYARGGELHGASHAQGGIKGSINGHNIELEGGEVVINKRSSAKYRKALSLINSDNGWGVDFANSRGGGYKFAKGGILGSYDFSPAPLPTQATITQAIAASNERTEAMIAATNRRIDRLQVQVNISDIENASEIKHVHINRASL